MTVPAFGLYPSSAMLAAQRIGAGRVIDLDRPVAEAGVTLFRASCWLPVPAALAGAQAAALAAGSVLEVEFAPRRYAIGLDDAGWFPDVTHASPIEVHVGFAWPAPVVRVGLGPHDAAHEIALLRADGDAVADEPTLTGITGVDLAEPWVGSPLVVRLGEALEVLELRGLTGGVSGGVTHTVVKQAGPDARAVRAAGASAPGVQPASNAHSQSQAQVLGLVTRVRTLTLAGTPTSPRLKLYAEQAGGATLLWQSMQPGAQGTVSLPAAPVTQEWAAAIEQVRSLLDAADAATAPQRLRLDIESDAPCRVRLAGLQLALEAELELLQAPQKFSFGGARVEQATLALELPAGAAPLGLHLAGRVLAEAAAGAAGPAPADGRRGALLDAGQAALQPVDLAGPARVAGLALYWQPLSDTARLRLRLRGDDGNGPGAKQIVSIEAALDTPAGGWLALRCDAIDLQAQRLWAELTVLEGSGLWLFGAGPAGAVVETPGAPPRRQALPEALLLQTLAVVADPAAARPISVQCGDQVLQAALPPAALALDVPAPLLATLGTQPIRFAGAVRGSVTVESARLRVAA